MLVMSNNTDKRISNKWNKYRHLIFLAKAVGSY